MEYTSKRSFSEIVFPAISGAWLLNKESFLNNIDWLDLLKLRLSYGLTGSDDVWKNMDKYPFGGGGGFVFGDDFIANGGIAEGQLPSLNATFEKVVKRISELIYEYWT